MKTFLSWAYLPLFVFLGSCSSTPRQERNEVVMEEVLGADKRIHYYLQDKDMGAGEQGFGSLLKSLNSLNDGTRLQVRFGALPAAGGDLRWPLCYEDGKEKFWSLVKKKSFIVFQRYY